jgi:hypothetical protein
MISSFLSSVKENADTSGEIAVNLYSSGLRKDCFITASVPSLL